MPNTPYRVVQWTTGNVGKSSVEAIAKNPNYELVGLYAWSQDKAGRDAGELAGIEPLGVKATNDVDALLALKPDVVVYNPMWIDVDELARILEAGVNVVSSASFITGHNLGDGRDKIEEACKRGNATLFGSGVSPGFAELLAIVAATACDRVDKVTISESADTTLYDSPDTERPVGFGTAIDDPNLAPMAANGTAVFAEAVRLVADSIGVELDEIKCVSEYAQTTEDLEMASWTIPAGHVAGVYASWQGLIDEPTGGQRTVVDVNVRWKKGQTLDPDWQLDGDGWKITIEGRPTVNMQVGFLPPQDMIENATSIEDFFVLGHIMTAMPPIHAIPAVVAAPPGIATYNDLPLPQARGVGPRR
ncbi:dihydrodipicolinate reductase [Mycobacterium sp. 852002-51961_SCH5331710]|uniref:NAD(P)H-dependent amine dehydrogenase family protein n=1 Tax=Mycobacterium sp. 852002-51961_SCH5331710 TaxID=1834105 RepID=UPI0007FE3C79|nr:dihydrodipicolinate reductase [Mycobacterium sp. 852002-51961_SCH5331710]OBB35467.1 dihydrodipicolinate reductase [Mycobacterium sp. 852002-51961_SCH5331710]